MLEQALLAVSDLIVSSSTCAVASRLPEPPLCELVILRLTESTYLTTEVKGNMLRERLKRLDHLIQFVRQMGLLDDISQPVRRQLAEDATSLAVGVDLSEMLSDSARRS